MKVNLSYMSFRYLTQLLSIYSEKSRSDDSAFKTKWQTDERLQIFGYQSPYKQLRLSVIRVDDTHLDDINSDSRGFVTVVPTKRGLATATDRSDLTIVTEPAYDHVEIRTGNLSYHINKSSTQPEMSLVENFLPMERVKLRGSVDSSMLQKYVNLAPAGPLKLEITNETVRFISSKSDRAVLDITDTTTVSLNNVDTQYKYGLRLISKAVKKFPSNKEIELYVNEDLIRFRCTLSDSIELNYYQRGR